MTITLTHKFVSAIPDGADATVVRPSNWNDTHDVSGTLPIANGGTNTASVPANGQILIGNGTDYTVANLTAGTGVTITNTAGGITLSAPDNGTVTGVTASSPLASSGGTAPDISLTGTVPVGNGGTGATTLTGYVIGNGTSAMTASTTIPTSNLTGTLPVTNGGTGQTTYTDGQLLIGNTTGNTLAKATLTAGTGVTITNGPGTITISAPDTGTVTAVTASSPLASSGGATPNLSLTGTVAIANGGTAGTATPTAGAVPYGTGTAYAFTNAGTTGQVLTSAGAGAPTWTTPTTGTVTSVTASSPLSSSGGATPDLSLTGTVPIANGGTNATAAPTAGAIAYGTGTAYAFSAAGTTGQVLTSNGAGAPTWAAAASGTVTSVAQSFTGGLISVAGSPITSSGTLALTVAGTSGGIPYFSSASTWATSAALAANSLVVGGGAGAAPATVTTGTGVVTALGVNTGTAGAFVVNGGALGTPSSGTATNLSGTAASLTAGTATNIAGGTAGQIPRQTGAGATGFTTATFPATAGASGNVLTSDGTNWSSEAPAAGGVTSITGTANQITVTGTTTPTLSIPTNPTLPGYTTSNAFVPSSSSVPTNGVYLPGANRVGFSSNSLARGEISSTGSFLWRTTTDGGFSGNPGGIVCEGQTVCFSASTGNGQYGYVSNLTNTGGFLAGFFYNGATVGTITTNGTITVYNTTSDKRLKTDFADLPPDLSMRALKAYRPQSYLLRGKPSIGATAQDVDERFKALGLDAYEIGLVTRGDVNANNKEGDKGYRQWGMDSSKIVPFLVSVVIDQHNQIETILSRLAALETK